ncbi:hypothetical protein [Cytobacillus massiliigabonensis]|uniref:hypothetical protein n=1 Tax=Cytobacillus massiliigabonensis TaxID=1871011 RepID=UPI000C85D5BD|nr:hypothetical protein [Cytobacillus massiliigabonensis]
MAEKNNSRELSIKLDVDVSEALTGLKAVQREAKKATQALRELEAAQQKFNQPITVAPLTVDSPFVAPLTVTDVPNHVKGYGESKTYVSTDNKTRSWFGGDCR